MELVINIIIIVMFFMIIGIYLLLWDLVKVNKEICNILKYLYEIGVIADKSQRDIYEINNDVFQIRNLLTTMIIKDSSVTDTVLKDTVVEKPKKKRRRRRRKKKSNEITLHEIILPPKPEDRIT